MFAIYVRVSEVGDREGPGFGSPEEQEAAAREWAERAGVEVYFNPDECVDCAACEPICPAEAIFIEDNLPEEWKSFAEINRLHYQDPAAAEAAVQAYRSSH